MARSTRYELARLIYSSMFLSLAILLPFLTQIKPISAAFCLMHLPVILCGFVCGPFWGMAVGITAPLLRATLFGLPVLFPNAFGMAFELATYAFVAGTLYKKLNKNIFWYYVSLISAMVAGRIVWGLVWTALLLTESAQGTLAFSFFWGKTVVDSIPGIIVQLVLIPMIIDVLKKNRLMLN